MRSALLLAGVGDALDPSPADAPLGRVADAVAPAVDEVVVACSADDRTAASEAVGDRPHRLAVDPIADEGAVAAIRTGVRVASGDAVAVVAGDVPTVDTSLLDDCFAACADAAAVPRSDDRLHPLHAAYDADAARVACDHTLAAGSGRLYDVLSRLDPVVVDAEAPDIDAHPLTVGSHADLAPATDGLGT
ncbi:NTP transferase domain-containing protein [Halosimplex rubrum]|uniref:NTP transferase domain-containing protein n=1 Tax=Halosimplex rubrum TaxID=869889 RepID=A0A7D5SVZ5_9EURY|nr:NTP transferase domain-containing protein [Halosimplex rubrum]QLH76131.1 NTP transferase domain-containing protein [Halosimplex rubrum]